MLVQFENILAMPIVGGLFKLDYAADPEKLDAPMQVVKNRLKAEPSINSWLLGEPEAITWSNLTEWGVQVRLMAKTLPGKQWVVSRWLRRFAVEALLAQGVRLAFPVTYLRQEHQSPRDVP